MKVGSRTALWELLKLGVALCLFLYLQGQILEIRRDVHGNSNGIAVAQSRQTNEFTETSRLLKSVLEDTSIQFTEARKVFEESTGLIQDERRELAKLIDHRTDELTATLKDGLRSERTMIEEARTRVDSQEESLRKLERTIGEDPFERKRRMIYPTVQLRGSGTVGSGVVIYSQPAPSESALGDGASCVTFVLTAFHVVTEVMGARTGSKTVEEVRLLGENDVFEPEVYSADLVIHDRDRDTALLRLRSGRRIPHVAKLAPRDTIQRLDVFARAYAVGCPLGNRPLPTVGEISSKSKVVGDQVFWMLSAPTFFGNSGGGVYLASNCELIGISSMIYTYGKESPTVVPHMGLFVSLDSVYDWLEREGFTFVTKGAPIPKSLWPTLCAAADGRPNKSRSESPDKVPSPR